MKVQVILNRCILAAVFFVPFINATAQTDMYVSPNTSVFVNNTVLCVINGLELKSSTSNMYLRNGAQLVQKHSGPSLNTGSGVLSVFQEGLANQWQFNYWCSPVGDPAISGDHIVPAVTPPDNNDLNGKFGITMLKRPIDVTASDDILPVKAPNYDGKAMGGTSGKLEIADYWINTFVKSNAYVDWHHEYAGTTIQPGYGFSMKGTFGTDNDTGGESVDVISGKTAENNLGGKQRYDFRGKPNDGDIVVPLSINGSIGSFTLIGNPYPSAIDLDLFFGDGDLVNSFSTDLIAYFWEQGPTVSHTAASFTGGYGVYCPYGFLGKGLYIPATFFNYDGSGNPIDCTPCDADSTGNSEGNPDREFVPIGQGFMVKADPSTFVSSKPYVIMKNSYRDMPYKKEGPVAGFPGDGSVFSRMKGQSEVPHIRFATTLDNGPISQIVQAFIPESTDGIDKGKDVVNPNNNPTMVNFLVKGKRCVLSSIPFDISRKIPLIFDNKKEANYKITVKEMINLDQVSNVYLHDKVADAYYDIKNSFYELILPAGMNYTQYEITFQKESALGVGDFTENSFMIYQDNSAKKMFLKNPNLKDIISCDLYDIAGKLIFSKKQLGIQDSYEFSTAELRDGIYIVKATTSENKTKGQKIIVKY